MKKGRVLFIIHDLYQEDNHFPLGVAYLSAMLKKNNAEVKVFCQDIFHYTNQELADYISQEEHDLIGVGFMATRFNETIRELCKVINENKKGAWLVLGGFGPAPIPEYMLSETRADIITTGEAEETIAELLNCKTQGTPSFSNVKGIAYQINGKIYTNEKRKPIFHLDSIPFPAWSLFPMDRYTTCLNLFNMEKDDKVLGILTSRGCVGKCSFCYRMEKGIRVRSIDNVIEEMKILKERYGVNYFFIQDELFVFSKKRIFEFAKALQKNNLKIKFACDCRVDIFDEEIAKCMVDIGCQFFDFGFESADQEVLNKMHKKVTVEQNIRAAEIVNKFKGIGMGLNFLWGNFGDTEKTIRKNVDFIKKYNTYHHLRTIKPVTPYPGSPLYYEAIKMGKLKGPEDFFEKFKNSDLLTVNFTNIPDENFYQLLLEANKELIINHYKNTQGNINEANELIETFRKLYSGEIKNFRGARHYERKI